MGLPREVLRTSRRPGHHHRQRTFPLPRGSLPAFLPRNGGLRHPRDHLQLHHKVRRGHQEGPVRQHRHVRWHHHVPRYRRQNAEGDYRPGSLHLPADVDLQAGVRRVRPIHCPPQVLLSASQLPRKKNNILDPIATIFIYLSVGFSLLFYSTTLPLPFGRLTLFHSTLSYIPSSTLTLSLFTKHLIREFCTLINCLLAPFEKYTHSM